jgi:hypothetical protein
MGSNVAGPLYWRQYNNSQLGISMKYPSNWFIAAQNEGTLLVRFCSAGCFANYNVRVQPISELPLSNSDINTIAKWFVDDMRTVPGFNLVSATSYTNTKPPFIQIKFYKRGHYQTTLLAPVGNSIQLYSSVIRSDLISKYQPIVDQMTNSIHMQLPASHTQTQSVKQSDPCMRNWSTFQACTKTISEINRIKYCTSMAIINNFPGSEKPNRTWDPYCKMYR